jgi:hypothetical protein
MLREFSLVLILTIVAATVSVGRSAAREDGSQRWTPSYKIKPHETDRLTAADVIGPDGIVYPDWRYAGVPGGIPDVEETARIEQFGGRADDGKDDSGAIAAGARSVARQGGGALVLGQGTYHLDQPVVLFSDGVVIRGQGPDRTRIVFRYGAPKDGVGFFGLKDGDQVGPDTPIEVHARPDRLRRIAIEADGKTITERTRGAHWGGTFMRRVSGSNIVSRDGRRQRTLTAVAEWDDGRTKEATIAVTADPNHRLPEGQGRMGGYGLGAIMFTGGGLERKTYRLASDGNRGDCELVLEEPGDLRAGDAVELDAPATPRWNQLVQNACKWGTYRRYQFRIESVDGSRVRLNQPLRIRFPVVDGSYLSRLDPVRRCGVESLSLEQTQKLWTCGILFEYAWECWARDVSVIKAGKHPVYTRASKWCEIRECEFDDAWYHGGGGTAYVGWERSYDCLMDHVTTRRMRHAPCVQWSSSGNVIRESVFHGSDAQWHAGWTNENLYELCTVDAKGSWGTYGHGGWASPPHDAAHGPEGPRNVIYNCDFRAPKTGLWMGGMNENWLILHNRFVVDSGPGIVARLSSFDHIIRGNVIAVRASGAPAIRLSDQDCIGIEVEGNRTYLGGGRLVDGSAQPSADHDNTVLSYRDDPPRPSPAVRSIFQWQRRGEGRGR